MRIAVLGAGAIGKVHLRLLNKLGIEEPHFLTRTVQSGEATSQYLYKTFGIRAHYHTAFDAMMSNGFDGAIICLPAELHYEYLIRLLSHDVPIFCEKPLFWNNEDSREDVMLKLAEISKCKNPSLLINTCNSNFINEVQRHEPIVEPVTNFKFNFFTNGPNRYNDIAIDLLPHALSLLIELLGDLEVKDIAIKSVEFSRFFCSFKYGNTHIEFDLREAPEISKELSFSINGRQYRRAQETVNSIYRVSLVNTETGAKYYMRDPFEVYLKRFLDSCNYKFQLDMEQPFTNFKKMCEIIFWES